MLADRGVTLPHAYVSWPAHDRHAQWHWVQILGSTGKCRSGFAVELSRSRALPGTYIARIERLGRALHADIPDLGHIIVRAARELPRVQRLDLQIFDENAVRRDRLLAQLESAGARQVPVGRTYRRTPVLQLGPSSDELFGRLSSRARRALRKFDAAGSAQIGPIEDPRYIPRLQELYASTFDRTGARPPPVDLADVLRDAHDGRHSHLAGVYWHTRPFPLDLVAVFWGRLHGDYASYDIGASERADDLGQVPLGYPLMVHLANWARERGATWLDMGGVPSEEVGPGHPLHGIVEFKRAFTQDERDVSVELAMEPWPALAALAGAARRAGRLVRLGR